MDLTFTGLQYNRLVKRWNGPESQANIYAKFGVGAADPFGEEDAQLAGFIELAADWETRRVELGHTIERNEWLANWTVRF